MVGPDSTSLKWHCKSITELEYHLEEWSKATTERLDWHNPENKPYRCVQNPKDEYCGNGKFTIVNKMITVPEEIEVCRDDQKLYTFKEGEELESENLKKQKLDENVEAEVDDDQEEAKMKKHMEIVPDDENIDREDMEILWKLVKAKHGLTRPKEGYERVLWGNLKVMFEPDVESEAWRNLQGHKVIGRIFRIKILHDDLGVNPAKVRVTAAKHNLALLVILVKNMLSISVAGIKVNAAGYNW
ncbi:hypothetical protein Tco_0534135 [Tanacetum coccineum]